VVTSFASFAACSLTKFSLAWRMNPSASKPAGKYARCGAGRLDARQRVGADAGVLHRCARLALRLRPAQHAPDEEDRPGEQQDHDEVHQLEAVERVTEQHGAEQSPDGEPGQRPEPAARTGGLRRGCARRSLRRRLRRLLRRCALRRDRAALLADAAAAAEALRFRVCNGQPDGDQPHRQYRGYSGFHRFPLRYKHPNTH